LSDPTAARLPRAGGRWLPIVTLLVATAVYGWTFVVVKDVIAEYPVLPYLGLRWAVATLALFVLLRRWPGRLEWRVGLPVGAVLAVGCLLQTEGMVTVSPGIAGLLTGLFVVFTPIMDRLIFKSRLHSRTLISVGMAMLGIAMLTGAGRGFTPGDLLLVLAALAFAGQTVLLSHARGSVGQLALVQMLACAVTFLLLGSTGGIPYPAISGSVAVGLIITGVLASALGVLAQTWAQRHVSASSAALVLAAEPAFAVAFAVVLVGERLGLLQLAGALLLLAAIVGHEIDFGRIHVRA
jgi:drug/metabolite transporter (DMT)-like permease